MLRQPDVPQHLLAYYRQSMSGSGARAEWAERASALRGPIRIPALYLHGADDGCIAVDVARRGGRGFAAGHEIVIIQGAGHFLHLERVDEVAAAILRFLQPMESRPNRCGKVD